MPTHRADHKAGYEAGYEASTLQALAGRQTDFFKWTILDAWA